MACTSITAGRCCSGGSRRDRHRPVRQCAGHPVDPGGTGGAGVRLRAGRGAARCHPRRYRPERGTGRACAGRSRRRHGRRQSRRRRPRRPARPAPHLPGALRRAGHDRGGLRSARLVAGAGHSRPARRAVHRGGRVRPVHYGRAGHARQHPDRPEAAGRRVRPVQRRRRGGRQPRSVGRRRSVAAAPVAARSPRRPALLPRPRCGSTARRVRRDPPERPGRSRPAPAAPVVWRLAGLFAVDSFAGGFVVQAYLVYWLQHRYAASTAVTGILMFAVGLLQTASFLAAPRIAHRVGLLPIMVFSHLPSNLLLAALAFAPNLATAVGLLLARTALSQMDVPTRQAYVMGLVPPAQRTRAAALTNTARYLTRPAGAALVGPTQLLAPGLAFVIAGDIKTGYDLTLWTWFRRVPLPQPTTEPAAATVGGTR